MFVRTLGYIVGSCILFLLGWNRADAFDAETLARRVALLDLEGDGATMSRAALRDLPRAQGLQGVGLSRRDPRTLVGLADEREPAVHVKNRWAASGIVTRMGGDALYGGSGRAP